VDAEKRHIDRARTDEAQPRSGAERHPRRAAEQAEGRILRLLPERGYGFIRALGGVHDGLDFFFHVSGLEGCVLVDLTEGDLVVFEPRQVTKGYRAEHIQRVLE
jgi:cold shock CspA family protein